MKDNKLKKVLQKISILNNAYVKYKWREKCVSYGEENPDKTFYVVRRAKCQCGLFSYAMTNIGRIREAIDRGYIPVVDMQNEPNTYLEDNEVGIKNAWEFYFEQPCGYTLADISRSKNVILGNGLVSDSLKFPDKGTAWSKEEYDLWHVFCKQYLKINESLREKFTKEEEEYLKTHKVIGVLARGTDYNTLKLKNHPIQPTADEIMLKVDELLKTDEYDAIYLATEDAKICNQFVDKYGDILYIPDVRRYHSEEIVNINEASIDRYNDRYLRGCEYLKSIWMLTQCKVLIAGNVSGTIGTLMLNDNYEYKYVFNKGLY